MDELQIYKSWPADVISEAVSEFNNAMHNGADVEEIQAGLHCLDFLTRKSEIPFMLQARIEGAEVEAHMRIELLLSQRENSAKRADLVKALDLISRQMKSILDRTRLGLGHEELVSYVERRIKERARR